MALQTKEPSKAVITSVGGAISGGTANSATPVITGTADAGNVVVIYDGVKVIGSAVAAANGAWTFTPAADIKSGSHKFAAIATDTEGNHGPSSVVLNVTTPAGLVAPGAPAITSLMDNVGTIKGPITNGMVTDDPRPVMSGTGTAGNVIKLYDGATLLGSATVAANGTWSVQPSAALSNGAHDLYATQTNAAGTSPHSTDIAFKVDISVPATPAAPILSDENGVTIPAGSSSTDTHPHIAGTGTAGDTITVYDNGKAIGSTTIDSNGKWDFTPSPDLSKGSHAITVIETNPAGTPSATSPATNVTLTIAAPVITQVLDAVGPITGAIPSNGVTDDNRPTVSGTGVPFEKIEVWEGSSKKLAATVADANGKWSVQLPTALADGKHDLTAWGVDVGDKYSTVSNHWYITVDTSVPAKPATPTLSDDSGVSIPSGSTTADGHPHISGKGTAGDTITVYDGSTVLGTATVAANGSWTFTPSSDLASGGHSINVTETNPAGTASVHSDGIAFSYSALQPPASPTLTGLVDVAGPYVGAVPVNGTASDAQPTLNGTGHAGDTINVYDGSTLLGTTTVNAGGTWSFRPATKLSDGAHAFAASETNAAGTSGKSSSWPFLVDTTSWSGKPTILLTSMNGPNGEVISDGGAAKAGTVVIHGWASDTSIIGTRVAIILYTDTPNGATYTRYLSDMDPWMDPSNPGMLQCNARIIVTGNTFSLTLTGVPAGHTYYLAVGGTSYSGAITSAGSGTGLPGGWTFTSTNYYSAVHNPEAAITDGTISATDAAVLHDSTAQPNTQHAVVGDHDTFVGQERPRHGRSERGPGFLLQGSDGAH